MVRQRSGLWGLLVDYNSMLLMDCSAHNTHIKGLNGIRALAAIVLLCGHLAQSDFSTWFASGGVELIGYQYVARMCSLLLVGFLLD